MQNFVFDKRYLVEERKVLFQSEVWQLFVAWGADFEVLNITHFNCVDSKFWVVLELIQHLILLYSNLRLTGDVWVPLRYFGVCVSVEIIAMPSNVEAANPFFSVDVWFYPLLDLLRDADFLLMSAVHFEKIAWLARLLIVQLLLRNFQLQFVCERFNRQL